MICFTRWQSLTALIDPQLCPENQNVSMIYYAEFRYNDEGMKLKKIIIYVYILTLIFSPFSLN